MSQPINNYFTQGLLHYDDGAYENAIDYFTRGIKLSLGDLAQLYLYRGMAYAYLLAYDRALADFNAALRRDPYLADAYNERGNILRIREQYRDAIEDYTAAIHLDNAHEAAYYNRGLTHELLGQYYEAEEDFNRAIELMPEIAPAYEARGRVRAVRQNFHGAIQDLEHYLRMGGGREFDNHSEIQSFILNLRLNKFLSRFLPAKLLPGNRV